LAVICDCIMMRGHMSIKLTMQYLIHNNHNHKHKYLLFYDASPLCFVLYSSSQGYRVINISEVKKPVIIYRFYNRLIL